MYPTCDGSCRDNINAAANPRLRHPSRVYRWLVFGSVVSAAILCAWWLPDAGQLVAGDGMPGSGPVVSLHQFYMRHPFLVWLALGMLVGLTPTTTLLLIHRGHRRRSEAALRSSRQRFMDFADTAADWFWETDDELRYTFISERHAEITGVARERLLGSAGLACSVDIPDEDAWLEFSAKVSGRLPFRGLHYVYHRSDGAVLHWSISGKPIYSDAGTFVGYRGTGTDITESQSLSARLSYQASHDALTGLINRRELELRLERVLQTVRHEGSQHAMCYLDLDQFKVVNDTCGHVAGDELLRQISSLLRSRTRRRDTVARLGGDEFGILMEHCSLQQARRVANALREAVADFRFFWEEKSFTLGVSIGVVPIGPASGDTASVLSAADAVCYAAKESGRNRVRVYQEDDDQLASRIGEMQWVTRIQCALDEDRLRLSRQSIHPLNDACGKEPHFELLLRMRDEHGRLVPPRAFLPAAERYNLMPRIDRWVCAAAFRWLAAQGERLPSRYTCSINLSGHSLTDEHFARYLIDEMSANNVQGGNICFEITETAAIANLTHARDFIAALAARGCLVSLDDVGSGLSSFEYLKNLPVDFLKIDGMFVRDVARDPIDYAMVKSINEIGHVMGKRTIAEFVESEEVLSRLCDIGIDYGQGFALGRPELLDVEPA